VARALLLLLAVVALGVALSRGTQDAGCGAAQQDAFAVGLRTPAGRALDPDAVAAGVVGDCRGGAPLAAAATGLLRGGAVDGAGLLAQTATDRDPEDQRGWRALAAVLRERGNEEGARAALDRARELAPERPAP
jgi:Flp pilus assembly protein TadD